MSGTGITFSEFKSGAALPTVVPTATAGGDLQKGMVSKSVGGNGMSIDDLKSLVHMKKGGKSKKQRKSRGGSKKRQSKRSSKKQRKSRANRK